MSGEAKMYTCSVCGKPTPNYHEWSPSVAAILGEQGSSTCDECSRRAQISYNGSCGETVGADVTATAYIEDIKYCPFCGEEL